MNSTLIVTEKEFSYITAYNVYYYALHICNIFVEYIANRIQKGMKRFAISL